MCWTEGTRGQTSAEGQRTLIWLALAGQNQVKCKREKNGGQQQDGGEYWVSGGWRVRQCWKRRGKVLVWRVRGSVGGVICLCQNNDEGARRKSSAVHLLASGGNTLTLALLLPSTCSINDSQGRPRVACIEDTLESGDRALWRRCERAHTEWNGVKRKRSRVKTDETSVPPGDRGTLAIFIPRLRE